MNPQMLFLLESLPPGRVFALDSQTLISIGIQFFNVALLAAALAFLLYNPVRNFMRRRTERITDQLIQAREGMAQATEMKNKYEKLLNDIVMERDQILSAARKLAAEKTKQMLSDAKNEAEAVKARAAIDIQMERERAVDEIRQSIVDVSSSMAAKLVEQYMDQNAHDKLLNGAMAELEEMKWPS